MHCCHVSAAISHSYEMDSMVRGFHICQSIRTPVISKELPCERQYYTGHDSFAVVIEKDSDIKFLTQNVLSNVLRSESITCRVTGTQMYSRDLRVRNTMHRH